MSDTSLNKLQQYLKEMFQFDDNDLDFGLFKIYKLKKQEIGNFIDTKLPSIVQKSLSQASEYEQRLVLKEIETVLARINKQDLLSDIAANKEKIHQYLELDESCANSLPKLTQALNVATGSIQEELQEKVYNYILDFFSLYYSFGDFGYNDRSIAPFKVDYEEDYDGSDTMFFWKHKNQYYIKSSNGFNSVKFNLYGDKQFRLETNEQSEGEETAQNNNKDTSIKHYQLNRIETEDEIQKIIFNLASESTTKTEIITKILKETKFSEFDVDESKIAKYLYDSDGKPIYKDLTDDCYKIQDGSVKGLNQLKVSEESALKKTNTNFTRNEKIEKDDPLFQVIYKLDKYINTFYIGNDADYFIHKDLHGFLTKEKEKYIKNHILADLNSILNQTIDNTTLVIAKCFDDITKQIINFLAVSEEFQKKLFTQKKKVIVSQYCLTVDYVPEALYQTVLDNQKQMDEWDRLYSYHPTSINDLKSHPTLMIDTKFYDQETKEEILANIDNLDACTNGLLINSENFQALNLLQDKYRNKVKCVYIDPPYNTASNGFIYKDNFKHSSWLTMLFNRLEISRNYLSNDGATFVSIDDIELTSLIKLCNQVFDENNFLANFLWRSRQTTDNRKWTKISTDHEYIISFAKNINSYSLVGTEIDSTKYTNPDNDPRGPWASIDLSVPATRFQRPNQFYDLIDPKTGNIYPANPNRVWSKSKDVTDVMIEEGRILFPSVLNGRPREKKFLSDLRSGITCSSTWLDNKIVGYTTSGTKELSQMFGDRIFDFPKPSTLLSFLINQATNNYKITLDFFAGSGTTGHAVIKLNKLDGGDRKYILVEMGEYFDSVLKPRIQKVVYSQNWKDGKPQDTDGSPKHIFKYQVLEQYEDVLNQIEIGEPMNVDGIPMKYWYRPEQNKLYCSIDIYKPFKNKIKYGKSGTDGTVDLPETYLYLKGYNTKSIKTYQKNNRKYLVYYVGKGTVYDTLIIWRDITIDETIPSGKGNPDLEVIKELLAEYTDVDALAVNGGLCFVDKVFASQDHVMSLGKRTIDCEVITLDDFDE